MAMISGGCSTLGADAQEHETFGSVLSVLAFMRVGCNLMRANIPIIADSKTWELSRPTKDFNKGTEAVISLLGMNVICLLVFARAMKKSKGHHFGGAP